MDGVLGSDGRELSWWSTFLSSAQAGGVALRAIVNRDGAAFWRAAQESKSLGALATTRNRMHIDPHPHPESQLP